jgi:hypothetical protein
VTATDVAEARSAADAGANALVLQGTEAGGHRASFVDRDDAEGLSTLVLLRLVRAETDLPLVAAGGITDGAALAAVLAAGAAAAQIGTAFLRADEAGTNPAYQSALASEAETAVTRAFTGRRARGLVNQFLLAHSAEAPAAYPQVHHATAPLRAEARRRGDADAFNLWAGQAHRLAVAAPAEEIVYTLARDARSALEAATARGRATTCDEVRLSQGAGARDETSQGPRQRQLGPAASREPVATTTSAHKTPGLEPTEPAEEASIADMTRERGRVRIPRDEREQPSLGHAST